MWHPEEPGSFWVDGYTPDQMAEEQAKYKDLVPVNQWLKAGVWPNRDEVAGWNMCLQYDQLVLHQSPVQEDDSSWMCPCLSAGGDAWSTAE